MRLQQIFTVVSLITYAHAWPWPPSIADEAFKAVEGIEGIFKRQNNNNNGNTQATSTVTRADAYPSTSQGTQTGTNSRSTITNGPQVSGTRTSGKNSSTTEFDPRDPAGGISMITPNPISGAQYFKIGDWVHFAWNYTSLQATPTAINVIATCTQNNAKYTLASNQSVGETGEIYWDTGAYQKTASVPLLTNNYQLIVWDASEAMDSSPRPGYLGSSSGFSFGMYLPQEYKPWGESTCPTCNSGAASLPKMTFTFLVGMVGITVLTSSWFVSGFSAI